MGVHSALDDRTRLVYSAIHDDETADTASAFWLRFRLTYGGFAHFYDHDRARCAMAVTGLPSSGRPTGWRTRH